MKTSIELPGFKNLRIIPYIRRRLVFSHLVSIAIEKEGIKQVLTDLPHSLNHGQLVEVAHTKFPALLSLIIRYNEETHRTLPLVPNDAGYLASFLSRMYTIPYQFVDDDRLLYSLSIAPFAPILPYRDDCFVYSLGLENYFAPLWAQLDQLWERVSAIQRAQMAVRAARVAERIKSAMARNDKTLLVCEYQLWWAVKKILEGSLKAKLRDSQDYTNELDSVLVIEDPYLFWTLDLLDDYPAINLEFCQMINKHQGYTFDKLAALENVLSDSFYNAEPIISKRVSIRRITSFRKFLLKRTKLSGRLVPGPSNHLLPGAASCFGRSFAKSLAKKLLTYPEVDDTSKKYPLYFKLSPNSVDISDASFSIPDILETESFFEQIPYSIRDQSNSFLTRADWANMVRKGLTKTETRELEGNLNATTWALRQDYNNYRIASNLTEKVLKRQSRNYRKKRGYSSKGAGIHWKATIRARANEEKVLYFKVPRKKWWNLPINETTPYVFIFSEDKPNRGLEVIYDSNIALRNINLENKSFPFSDYPEPDSVYSLARLTSKRVHLNKHIEQSSVIALASLYSTHIMGIERYEAINKRPAKFQCRKNPRSDNELNIFTGCEKLLAWAIKYAESAIVILAFDGWQLPVNVASYAQSKKVELIQVPLSLLADDFIRRLQNAFHISTPLKKHPAQKNIMKRFVDW